MGLLMTKMVEQGSRVGYICPITVGGELFVVVDGFTIFGDNIYHTDAVKLRSNIGQTRHVVLFWVQRNPRNQWEQSNDQEWVRVILLCRQSVLSKYDRAILTVMHSLSSLIGADQRAKDTLVTKKHWQNKAI
uniref:Uncharacterized protein n=1 Tax=Schistocephalus solidus TaxID=70667 RepID=A0A0X3P7X9_SCHSO